MTWPMDRLEPSLYTRDIECQIAPQFSGVGGTLFRGWATLFSTYSIDIYKVETYAATIVTKRGILFARDFSVWDFMTPNPSTASSDTIKGIKLKMPEIQSSLGVQVQVGWVCHLHSSYDDTKEEGQIRSHARKCIPSEESVVKIGSIIANPLWTWLCQTNGRPFFCGLGFLAPTRQVQNHMWNDSFRLSFPMSEKT